MKTSKLLANAVIVSANLNKQFLTIYNICHFYFGREFDVV